MADFLVVLADFDRRRSWEELGYSSLFYFLHRELGLSKGAAHYRKTAAELVQRFPEIVEPLRDGFFQRSKREAALVAALLQPATAGPHRDVVTALPVPARLERLSPSAEPPSLSAAGIGPAVQPVEPELSLSAVPSPLRQPAFAVRPARRAGSSSG